MRRGHEVPSGCAWDGEEGPDAAWRATPSDPMRGIVIAVLMSLPVWALLIGMA